VEKIKNGRGNVGYDALKDEFVPDMIVAGIIDPVKVTRLGVENACSAAAILLTTEPLFAGLFGYLLAGDRLGALQILGAAMILGAVVLAELVPARAANR